MTSKVALVVIQGVLLYPALLWKVYQLTRAPSDVARWMVTACLACFAASYPLGLIGVFFDKRDDELQPASDLPQEIVLTEEGGAVSRSPDPGLAVARGSDDKRCQVS